VQAAELAATWVNVSAKSRSARPSGPMSHVRRLRHRILEDAVKKLLVAAIISAAAGCAPALAQQPLTIGTSLKGTLTFSIGTAVAKALQDAGGMAVEMRPQSGTGTLIPRINSGEVDIGFANTLELYEAFHGVGGFDKRPNARLRTVAVIFPIKVGLLVRNDAPIRSVQDLKGKTLAYGFTSQETVRNNIDAMLATGGLSAKDMQTLQVPDLVVGIEALVAGKVDATSFAIGSPKVAEADAAVGVRYLSLDDGPKALVALKTQFLTAYTGQVAPAPNRAGVREPISTMFYDYTIFANANVPASRIRAVVAAVAQNRALLAQVLPQFADMDPGRLYSNIDVPFHPGAVAYFGERMGALR
jgi:TRAP transporter TAXI family solute receptor